MRRLDNAPSGTFPVKTPVVSGPSRRAFTLVELLVVIGIIAILITILIPVVGRARRASRSVVCLANLRSLHTALMSHVNTNRHSVDYAAVSTTNANATTNVRSRTWEGQLRTYYGNDDKVRLCAEATEAAESPIGSAFLAHGSLKPPTPAMVVPPLNDTWSYGSYTINGFLYYLDPAQMKPPLPNNIAGGAPHVTLAQGTTQSNYWFEDLATLDGGVVPASVIAASGGNVPPNFGPASSVPAFGDGNDIDAWPMSIGTPSGKYDPTPAQGAYATINGDKGNAKGHSLGRFALARHPGGTYGTINIVFLDGHARSVPLQELWQLRWNKNFVPVPNVPFP